jgi:4-hydroxy-tetrahydrodipicolinate reductase
VCRAVIDAPGMELVAAVDPLHAGIDLGQLGVHGTNVHISAKAAALREAEVQVAVDFTVVDAARENLAWCADNGVHAVVGTSGFTESELGELAERFRVSDANAVIAPNFAIGAVLMMRFAEQAAPYFESVEIIELHHDQKKDAPSGTAKRTAELIGKAGGHVHEPIHSVRLPGLVAHQEVIIGGPGEILTIRHDTTSREAFAPGVLLALDRLRGLPPGLTVGLEALL